MPVAMTDAIATDLLTPLGAYLRLREGARGAFLLELARLQVVQPDAVKLDGSHTAG